MFKEYPKALYKGDTTATTDCVVVADKYEEDAQRENGYEMFEAIHRRELKQKPQENRKAK